MASAYVPGGPGGSTAAPTDEVWLRGNVRPVVGAGLLVGGVLAAGIGVAAVAGVGPSVAPALAVTLGAVAVAGTALAAAAAGPRIGRRGDRLLVRLSPWRTTEVPLAVVECVFPGSQPVAGPVLRHVHAAEAEAAGPSPTRRVGTLVIRFAERAAAWRERPTFPPWGTWHDGHAIIDGRWCEPLSAEVARAVSHRLLEAKRDAAAGAAEAGR